MEIIKTAMVQMIDFNKTQMEITKVIHHISRKPILFP